MFKRVFLIVIDSVGCGEAPDAHLYGDSHTNTLFHTSKAVNGLKMPNMEALGLGCLTQIIGINPINQPKAVISRMHECSKGKDTLTGHWEMMGLKTINPFKTYTETGFPDELISELENRTNRRIIGNKAASGTEIIKELGEEHLKTGDLIVYTSADSVLQIAANEEIVPLDELYRICQIARDITKEKYPIGRVIARPFIGNSKENFTRTANRHDYSLKPFDKTVLNSLKNTGYDVISVGKIADIFDLEGITEYFRTKSNDEGMKKVISLTKKDFTGLCFANLVDFDSLYGHRRDPKGYAKCLEDFDLQLGCLLKCLESTDLLIITADHGNDPTHSGTDHTRELVPLLMYNEQIAGKILPDCQTFADIGATIADNFKIESPKIGKSLILDLKRLI